jgi:hypothetical protein
MTIWIEKAKQEDRADLLKTKALTDHEYVILSKSDRFDEPLSGETTHGTWYLYNIDVYEYVTVDLKTLQKEEKKFDEPLELGFFTDPDKKYFKDFSEMPAGTKFKIFMEDGKKMRRYTYEIVGDVPVVEETTADEPSNDTDEIKAFIKKSKPVMDEDDLLEFAANKFGTSKSMLKTIYDSL